MEHTAALLGVGVLGGLAARRLRVPGGMLLGALVASALLSILDGPAAGFPQAAVPAVQTLVGAMLGLSLGRETMATVQPHGRLIGATAVLTAVGWAAMALTAAATGMLEPAVAVVGSAPAGPAISLLLGESGVPLAAIAVLLVLRVALVGGVLSAFLGLRQRWPRRPTQARADRWP